MDSMEEIYRQHAKTVYKFLSSKRQCEQVAEELTKIRWGKKGFSVKWLKILFF